MKHWFLLSWLLCFTALLSFTMLVCATNGLLPEITVNPLQATAFVSSAAAGMIGYVVSAVMDWRGETRKALLLCVASMVSGLPVAALLMRLIVPDD